MIWLVAALAEMVIVESTSGSSKIVGPGAIIGLLERLRIELLLMK